MSDSDQNFKLLLAFDTDDSEFVRGFQVGSLWAQVQFNRDSFSLLVYGRNAEMVMRILEQSDRERTVTLEDDWLRIDVGPHAESDKVL